MEEQKTNTIYQKLAKIQAKIKDLKKDAENKFQKYSYFTEAAAIKILKPLLETEKLAVLFTDSDQFFYEKQDKDHILRYLKRVNISDGENEGLTFNLWAVGQDPDISKAKGKAETYAIKYFLSKFFMIPIVDDLDPDRENYNRKLTTEEQQKVNQFFNNRP
ncbi:MAG: single-stranded DNA-binding protein [Mycoplasmataceae bacterium RV_VA103A]|nr:MAG: single-stranded DNA-binding protein [Mycoplasmataceae bacterium RV_VA103A]